MTESTASGVGSACAACGRPIGTGARRCMYCGAVRGHPCPHCGDILGPMDKSCRKCRAPVTGGAGAPPAVTRPAPAAPARTEAKPHAPAHPTFQHNALMVELNGPQAVVTVLSPDLRDAQHVSDIVLDILAVVQEHGVFVLALNCLNVQHMSTVFLTRLTALQATLKERRVALRVCGLSPEALQAFKLCNLDKRIPVYDSVEKALAK